MYTKNSYLRKISSQEANENFIFILKAKLSLFPRSGEKFIIESNYLTKKCRMESYPCTCRGHDKPHEHYFIRWEGLESGDRIKIIKKFENEDIYNLIIVK